MAVSKKKKMSLPPKPLTDNEGMQKMINKGGSATVVSDFSKDELKSFTIKIYESELVKIRTIIGRESKRDKVSIRTFITDAVLKKISEEY
jgi:hypothetical protein